MRVGKFIPKYNDIVVMTRKEVECPVYDHAVKIKVIKRHFKDYEIIKVTDYDDQKKTYITVQEAAEDE